MADDWKPATFRDRVTELRRVPASDLKPHPMNWREHPPEQRLALRGVLKEIGFAGAELAYVADADKGSKDAPLTLIDGHARREEVGNQVVPVLVLDLTDDEANKLLATFDPLSVMAEANKTQLKALLDTLQTSDEYVSELLAKLAEENDLIPPDENVAPDEFKEVGEDIEVNCTCPKCGYQWSDGK